MKINKRLDNLIGVIIVVKLMMIWKISNKQKILNINATIVSSIELMSETVWLELKWIILTMKYKAANRPSDSEITMLKISFFIIYAPKKSKIYGVNYTWCIKIGQYIPFDSIKQMLW